MTLFPNHNYPVSVVITTSTDKYSHQTKRQKTLVLDVWQKFREGTKIETKKKKSEPQETNVKTKAQPEIRLEN